MKTYINMTTDDVRDWLIRSGLTTVCLPLENGDRLKVTLITEEERPGQERNTAAGEWKCKDCGRVNPADYKRCKCVVLGDFPELQPRPFDKGYF